MDICVFFLFRAISNAMDILTHFCTHFVVVCYTPRSGTVGSKLFCLLQILLNSHFLLHMNKSYSTSWRVLSTGYSVLKVTCWLLYEDELCGCKGKSCSHLGEE